MKKGKEGGEHGDKAYHYWWSGGGGGGGGAGREKELEFDYLHLLYNVIIT